MISTGQSLLTTIAALAATFLALSLLVQVMQEVYKYLSSSQARSYRMTLVDFLGPWASRVFDRDAAIDLKLRGPFQLRKVLPPDKLLPLDKDDLAEALERTLSPWHREALQALRIERRLQEEQAAKGDASGMKVSPSLAGFVQKLTTAAAGSPGYQAARDIYAFLEQWMELPKWPATEEKAPPIDARALGTADARALTTAFSARFMPHIVRATDNYSQLMRNFEHNYRRRNLRQTFTFAFLIALAFELPFGRLYRQARQIPADEAWRMLADASAAYDSTTATGTVRVPRAALPPSVRAYAETVLAQAARDSSRRVDTSGGDGIAYGAVLKGAANNLARRGIANGVSYTFGSLITALLVCFGAPLWNDMAKSLLRLRRGPIVDTDRVEAHT